MGNGRNSYVTFCQSLACASITFISMWRGLFTNFYQMVANPFTEGITLELKFSLYFSIILFILYIGTLYVLLTITLPITGQTELKLALGIMVIMHAVRTYHEHVFLQHHPLHGAQFIGANTLVLRDSNITEIAPYSYVSRYFIVLIAELANRQHSLIIFPDSLPDSTFRFLQIRLRHVYQTEDDTN